MNCSRAENFLTRHLNGGLRNMTKPGELVCGGNISGARNSY